MGLIYHYPKSLSNFCVSTEKINLFSQLCFYSYNFTILIYFDINFYMLTQSRALCDLLKFTNLKIFLNLHSKNMNICIFSGYYLAVGATMRVCLSAADELCVCIS